MIYLRNVACLGATLFSFPALATDRDAFSQMWHDMAETEYAEMHSPAYAEALAECILAVFVHLDPADRDILAEHAMNPPEPDASRIEALLPGHAQQMLACGETVRPEDFAN